MQKSKPSYTELPLMVKLELTFGRDNKKYAV